MASSISSDAVDLARTTVDRTANTPFSDYPVDPAGPPVVLLLAEIATRLERIESALTSTAKAR